MDAAERKEILSRYMDHQRRFEAVAAKRQGGNAEVIPFNGPLRELEQEPTMREIEVLQLISDGLVNREIGHRLFLSEETVKSHLRHLLAKLQARSRAHAVAVGFRRGLIPYLRPSTARFPHLVEIPRQGDVHRLWRTEATRALPGLVVARDCSAGHQANHRLTHCDSLSGGTDGMGDRIPLLGEI